MKNLKKTLEELDRISVSGYKQLEKNQIVVILDNVRSAHNVGSVFRTCDAFLVEKLVLCGITPQPPNNEIHKTALGATESVEWQYFEKTEDAINYLRDEQYQLYSIEQANNSIALNSFTKLHKKKIAFIFGHEVYGVEQKVIDFCDGCIEIPQFGTKHSLNVSVCVGITLYYMVF